MTETPELVINRTFKAPRPLVWKAWTDPDLLAQWYGPGVETVIHGYDLKPGGEWRNEMKFGDKSDLSKMVFQEVTPPEKLVWHHHSADRDWNIAANPMMPNWPKTLLTTVTFADKGPSTDVRFAQVPLDATDEEAATFAQMAANMSGGWGKGFEVIDEILADLQSS